MINRVSARKKAVLSAACAALAFVPASARAQQTAEVDPQAAPSPGSPATTAFDEGGAATQEIIVTGSRLGRSSFNSPTPVNVVGQDRVQNLNITAVGDALNQIPAFRPFATPATNSFRVSGNIAARSLDLRGLGTTRTLTLIDGRRNVPSDDNNTFDLNAIPSIMVQRSEVVTGDASAAYGADAVAGVVNLILNTRFTGIKGEINNGISQRGDARNLYAALMAGTPFAGGRGHLVVGGEYTDEGAIGDYNTRRWSRKFHSFIPNPFFNTNPALSNGQPANVAIDNVLYVLNPAGLISSVHPLQGNQFDQNGNLVPFQFGSLFDRGKPSNLMVGGDPSVRDLYGFNKTPILVPTSHYSALAHADFDVSDSITATGELSYARVSGGPTYGATISDQNGALRVNIDNPFLSAATVARMRAANVTFLPISRSNGEIPPAEYRSRNKTLRALAALKGELGANWKWDAFYQYGRVRGFENGNSVRLEQRWRDAVDAVRVTADNVGTSGLPIGSIVCRTTLASPTNGCVVANVVGEGKVSQAAVNYVTGAPFQNRKFSQHQLAANLRGTLFEGWAGPVSVAAGGEYRVNTAVGDNDAASKASLFNSVSSTQLPQVRQKVTEGYLEANLPVFKDWVLGKSFEIDGAVRGTHYSLSGNATTWKVGAVYQPSDEYMVRVTRSHDIRAPSPLELNPNVRTLTTSQADPKLRTQYQLLSVSGGNPNLSLERANTFTAGIVPKPEWLPRFRLSVDYYNIKVSGAIDIVSLPLAVLICRNGTRPDICVIGTDAAGNPDRILRVNATYQNVNELRSRGFEIVSSYSADLSGIAPSLGTLNVSINGNWIDTLSTTLPDGSVQEFSDQTGNQGSVTTIFGVPKWKADAVVTYEEPTWSVTTQFRYIPRGILSRTFVGPQDDGYTPYLTNSINDNRVAARFYVNLNGRIRVMGDADHSVEFFGGINNLFDKDPPSNLRFTGNGLYFDPVGRAYRMGFRANW